MLEVKRNERKILLIITVDMNYKVALSEQSTISAK